MKSRSNKLRRFLAGYLQHWAWLLSDPFDTWLIDYKIDNSRYHQVVNGPYHMGLAKAKELKGKIIGYDVQMFKINEETA